MVKKFHLKIIEGNNVDAVFEIEDGVRYEIRRTPSDGIPANINRKTAIFINDPEVSKLHAGITVIAGELVIQDLGSTNGIFINNKRVKKSLVVNNDRIKIGMTIFMVKAVTDNPVDSMTFVGVASSTYSKQTHEFKRFAKVMDEKISFNPDLGVQPPYVMGTKAYQLFADILDSVPTNPMESEYNSKDLMNGYYFQVKIVSGEKEGAVFHFYKKKIIIGRTKDMWLYDKSVSREHAEVTMDGPRVFKIKDLGSQNGTFINGQKVQTATFREKDAVKLGDTVLNFAQLSDVE